MDFTDVIISVGCRRFCRENFVSCDDATVKDRACRSHAPTRKSAQPFARGPEGPAAQRLARTAHGAWCAPDAFAIWVFRAERATPPELRLLCVEGSSWLACFLLNIIGMCSRRTHAEEARRPLPFGPVGDDGMVHRKSNQVSVLVFRCFRLVCWFVLDACDPNLPRGV